MKATITPSNKLASYLVLAILALVPFHAFLTVWGSTLVGHYTALRLWDDVVLVALTGIVGYWLSADKTLRAWLLGSLLVRLIAAYAVLTLLLGVVSYAKGDVSGYALGYGVLSNLRFLAWFLAVLLTVQRSPPVRQYWWKVALVPAAAVVGFALLQYTVLPHNFLTHFGYHTGTTIPPIETINHNSHYIRVQSTLRGANPLGAYLVIILSALGVLFWQRKQRNLVAIVGLGTLAALYASGSRSAWIGAALSIAVIVWFNLKTRRGRLLFGGTVVAVLILATSLFLALKNNVGLQNAVLHTQNHSTSAVSSNGAHASALKAGVEDVLHQPYGDGPGTAGPASAHNTKQPARIAEDYYIQVAQETGWLGLLLFLSILALVAWELYTKIDASPLALATLAAFVGIAFVNLLSHAWTDDTLAFLWWGMAGIALASPVGVKTRENLPNRGRKKA